MKKLLHIIATPRGNESNTLQVSGVFMKAFQEKHPECVVDVLDLSTEALPPLTVKRLDGKYMLLQGKDLQGDLKESWNDIVAQIERFQSADAYLLSTPMWNFNIPYALKQYIDVIVQPKYLFRYTKTGPEGLVKGKKMAIITSRGGDYVSAGMKNFDMQEPYLRTVFGFIGITDVTFIHAQPMGMGEDLRKQKIVEAQAKAQDIGSKF